MKLLTRCAFVAVATLGLAPFTVAVMAQQVQHDHKPGDPLGKMGGQDGMMGMMGMMMGSMMRDAMASLDTNADGTLSAEEMTAGIQGELKTYDTDANGSLSLEEFAILHAAHIRPMMVRAFQMHDTDGDGQVTEAEMAAMAAMMQSQMAAGADEMPGMGQSMTDDN